MLSVFGARLDCMFALLPNEAIMGTSLEGCASRGRSNVV